MAAVLALLSSLMWGASDFLGGVTSRRMPPAAVYGLSQAVGLVSLVLAATVSGGWSADAGAWIWAVVSGLLGLGAMLAFYSALAIGPMGIVAPLVGVSTVVPVLFALLRGEWPGTVALVGIVVAILGVVLACGPELTGAQSAKPLILAGFAALSFGVMYVTMAAGSATAPTMTVLGMRVTVVAVLGAAAVLVRSIGGPTARDVPVIVAIGVLDATANLLYAFATTLGLLATTSVLASLYPVVTAVLAGVLLHERLRQVQYVGIVVAVLGVAMISAG